MALIGALPEEALNRADPQPSLMRACPHRDRRPCASDRRGTVLVAEEQKAGRAARWTAPLVRAAPLLGPGGYAAVREWAQAWYSVRSMLCTVRAWPYSGWAVSRSKARPSLRITFSDASLPSRSMAMTRSSPRSWRANSSTA